MLSTNVKNRSGDIFSETITVRLAEHLSTQTASYVAETGGTSCTTFFRLGFFFSLLFFNVFFTAAHLGLLRFLPHLRAFQNRSADYKNQVPQQCKNESLACSKEMRSLVCRIFGKIHVCFTVHLRADYDVRCHAAKRDEGILVSRLRNKSSQRFLYGVTVSTEVWVKCDWTR